jgi:phosphoribosylformimino-5-aminoimidazole carboxamide ribotide isomerase
MEIIPVIDIKGGKAVAGKSGDRKKYEKLKTVFARSSDPLEIAQNIPSERLYIADLNGVMEGRPDLHLLGKLSKIKRLMVDAGIRDYEDFRRISRLDLEVIAGTETLKSLKVLEGILRANKNVIVSLDIKNGRVLSPFLPLDPKETFELLKEKGAKRFILLNISSVGTLSGFDPSLLEVTGDTEIYVGGGIKKEDLERLKKAKISGALVGTALHRGVMEL